MDAAAKLAVTHFDTLLPSHPLREDIGETAPRPTHGFMYTAKPPPPVPVQSTGTNCATLCRPRWAVPEAQRMQMHAFTRPSPQLRLKVEMRYCVSFTTLLFTRTSSSPSKRKEPGRRLWAKRSTKSLPIASAQEPPFSSLFTDNYITAN